MENGKLQDFGSQSYGMFAAGHEGSRRQKQPSRFTVYAKLQAYDGMMGYILLMPKCTDSMFSTDSSVSPASMMTEV